MLLEKTKNKFKEIKDIFFEKDNKQVFLRVEVSLADLTKITLLTKEISHFLDQFEAEIPYQHYFLDVYSSGAEKIILWANLSNYINQKITIKTNQMANLLPIYTGKLLSVEPFIIRYNNRGRWQKLELNKAQIKEIRLALDFKNK